MMVTYSKIPLLIIVVLKIVWIALLESVVNAIKNFTYNKINAMHAPKIVQNAFLITNALLVLKIIEKLLLYVKIANKASLYFRLTAVLIIAKPVPVVYAIPVK